MFEFLQPHLTEALTALVGGFFGWFFTRKKQLAELQANELDNVDKAIRIYREMIENLGAQLKTAITELDEAKKTIKELEEKVEALTRELTKYKQLNGKAKV
ncbi:cell wall anchor protein [Ornithobacterium rhinotracheale]|uniref:cell wall anchor protein n=1 Tax=Ornithobacterium rhinotracheale TaxID=28251 RepID=UPI00129CD846|nr:cell wall anchor protein [Ornithobacterium rhinotracheale]MRJ11388.1 cell wall anchor protein [Ornithobacterium rhinotracheale]